MKMLSKKFYTIIMTLVIAFAFTIINTGSAYALSARIAFTDLSTEVGSEFSVNMKISSLDGAALGSANIMLNYDPSYIEFIEGTNAQGGAGSIKVSGATEEGATTYTYALKFKALQAGETTISVGTWEIYDADAKMASLDKQGTGTVTIGGGATSSADANLTSLKISPGSLSPEFSADITEYKAVVGGDVDKITISAPTSDSEAKVVITGNSDLVVGDNTISCKVTASDGATVKTYSIIVTKQEGEVPEMESSQTGPTGDKATIGGVDYDIASTFDESLLPEGFEMSSYTFGDKEVAAGKGIEKDLVLLYLIAPDGSGDFYIYDSTTNSWSPYAEISVTSKTITIVPLDNTATLPEGFSETTLELNGKKVQGWIWASDSEQRYCIVYAMNWDGEKNFYRYDMKEKTLQRYFEDPAIDTGVSADDYQKALDESEELQKKVDKDSLMIVGLIGVCAILLIVAILLMVALSRGKKHSGSNPPDDTTKDEEHAELKKQKTPEERYLAGDDIDTEDDIKLQDETERIKKESQQQLLNELKESELKNQDDSDSDSDDDFETLDI